MDNKQANSLYCWENLILHKPDRFSIYISSWPFRLLYHWLLLSCLWKFYSCITDLCVIIVIINWKVIQYITYKYNKNMSRCLSQFHVIVISGWLYKFFYFSLQEREFNGLENSRYQSVNYFEKYKTLSCCLASITA